jgi:phospholipid/cholesterol/gamma-HCH transport system substrate-binding protein
VSNETMRKYAKTVAAMVFLVVIALAIGTYVLSNQRFYAPAWVPVIGSDFYEVEAELQTAQAVVPGQGQTVNIAGVNVGDIGSVHLEDGRAIVEMKIKRKYAPIYRDATILLRPKTGLKDMYIALDPGTEEAGEIPEGGRIPAGSTLPDVNPDEVLAALDADTRDYLRILLNAGAEALDADGPAQLRQVLKRFEPTARDVEKVTAGLAERRQSIRRVIHNFQELATELGANDRELAEFVGSANANFEAIANQDASLRAAVRQLPGTLGQTATTLRSVDTLSDNLGPALQELRPGARALAGSLRKTRPFLRTTTPTIRDELRPFARDVRPTVRDLRRAAEDLAVVTPRLTRSVRVINSLLNTVAYNPPGPEEGYLFWGSWANHAGATIFGTQDAHGPVRRGLVLVSCAGLGVLDQIKNTTPSLDVLVQLLNAPRQSDVCPKAVP